jgi:hypothetical protein
MNLRRPTHNHRDRKAARRRMHLDVAQAIEAKMPKAQYSGERGTGDRKGAVIPRKRSDRGISLPNRHRDSSLCSE